MKVAAIALSIALGLLPIAARAQEASLKVDWSQTGPPTKTVITLQVVENPLLERGSSIHDAAWKHFGELHAQKARLALWYPYPGLAVAELAAPASATTSWNFKSIDPIVEDFFRASGAQSSVFEMSTIPSWMFRGGNVPALLKADETVWDYESGSELVDPTGKQVADYFARLAGWYTAGGFQDEHGVRHASGHFYKLPYWEVLNEPEYEHALSIETYTRIYDQVAAAVHRVSPSTKFVGMSLARPSDDPSAFEYFLNPAHHLPGTPLDALSFHFYAQAEPQQSSEAMADSFFAQTDGFVNTVRYILAIRNRLSPHTEVHINEVGCISADDQLPGPHHLETVPGDDYWRLCGAMFASLYVQLSAQGVDVLGASQLLGYPGQYPSVSLLDWKTGSPNARYDVLHLLIDNFGPGQLPAKVSLTGASVQAAAFSAPDGRRTILLVEKSSRAQRITLDEDGGALAQGSLGCRMQGRTVQMEPFAVCVVHSTAPNAR